MLIKRILFCIIFILFSYNIFAQTGTPVNGAVDNYERITAFTNCTLVKDPQTKIVNAVLIIQKGKITNLEVVELGPRAVRISEEI